MNRFDGTAARQLDLIDDDAHRPVAWRQPDRPARPPLRMLQKDIYAELARRRRKAQIAARHLLDRDGQ